MKLSYPGSGSHRSSRRALLTSVRKINSPLKAVAGDRLQVSASHRPQTASAVKSLRWGEEPPRILFEPSASPPDSKLGFLVRVLQATWHSCGSLRLVYPLLVEQVDTLDSDLIYVLHSWTKLTLCKLPALERAKVAGALVDFAGILRALPDGDQEMNLEIAIVCCEMALLLYEPEAFPWEWGTVHNNLAIAYSDRAFGDGVENTCNAYTHYYQAKQIFTRQGFPQKWIAIQTRRTPTLRRPIGLGMALTLRRFRIR
ncbi:MAG TPA: hypothetical protein IGS52_13505 [Oscillatoriaceae cyanobacterium M33_DOE_052]|uniref:Uncharacterized protein n=1 Tax=Planktothricoides sp. SpSt-374 TaxID=2282167 RepID=A0A7C3VHT3_9CYAN|nr:hypothetical protein [Oscillatoriaceae cyanobacterium M33_DOE_052]